uniref:Uncharacterized protein n=1 Tax=Fopius arisanus TaxID=64838 RepID=A0A0C9RGC0_9HYME
MRLLLPIILTCLLVLVTSAEDSEEVSPLPPIKIDKHLRRALLKALEDLEAESEEQKEDTSPPEKVVTKVTDNIDTSERFSGASFSFSGFPSDSSEIPSEEKLQNSTFVESEKLETTDGKETDKATFQKFDVLLGDKEILEKSPNANQVDQILTRSVEITSGKSVNSIDRSPKQKDEKESLSFSSSNGIASASANSLIPPSPTPPSPTVKPVPRNLTSPLLPTKVPSVSAKPEDSEVKIFQAPLVAAFTVQQDERGVPKSVVPLYKPGTDNQGLSLQEQLDFKQQLLERQLAELQAQHAQQTQFLYKQQLLYQEQLRLKQRQQLYLQEQARLKQIEEQRTQQLKQAQQQVQQQVQEQLRQGQNLQGAFSQNNLLTFQPPLQTQNVQFQPSVAFQLPNAIPPPPFAPVPSVQDQLRLQLQRQQILQQQAQQLQQQRQQAVFLQQQRLQQSFPGFQNDFQPPAPTPATRFNRQEAFGTVGNFGVNDNRQIITRNHLEPPRLPPQDFGAFNNFGFRGQNFRPQTPARQIQHLLFQSGVAGALQSPQNQQGRSNQEDLNIVSKVLALNVGAVPTKNLQFNDEGFRA